MTPSRRALVASVALATLVGLAPAATIPAGAQDASEAGPSLFIGVIRGDGVMLPVAVRRDGQWVHARVYDASEPRGLYRLRDPEQVPRAGWTLHARGESSRLLELRDMVDVDAYCMMQQGIGTDTRPAPDTVDSPHLTWAAATTGGMTAAPIEDALRGPDEAARRVIRFVADLVASAETERLAARPQSPLAAVDAAERARVAPEVTMLLRSQAGTDRHAYYFEARKRYPRVQVYAQGWLESSSFRLSVLRVDSGVDAGGESARPRGRVLAALRVGPNTVWVMEMRGYEGSSYEIVETGFGPHLLSVSGGGC
jgi:hypothetical protein